MISEAVPRVPPPAVAPLVLILSVGLLAACGGGLTEEALIKAHLQDMAAALEEQNTRRFANYLAEDFGASTYNLDRNGARLLLRREMMARERIRARLINIDVELRGDARAVATFRALLTGGSGLIPDEGRLYRVTTGWRLDDGEWRMISAAWESAGQASR